MLKANLETTLEANLEADLPIKTNLMLKTNLTLTAFLLVKEKVDFNLCLKLR